MYFLALQVAHAQNTCLNANNLLNTNNAPIPPPGTVSPSGPALGCLSLTERQVWFSLPVCHTNANYTLNSWIFDSMMVNYDTIGVVVYGPFSQKVTNCFDLTAGKILYCSEQIFLSPFFSFGFNDTLFEGNYYYFLFTFSSSPSLQGITLSYYPGNNYTCFECNNQPSVIYKNNLCLVSVDTAINKCTLTWEEFPATNLAGYKIMRESTFTGVYDSLTTIPVGSLSIYTDLTSSPVQRNYTYAVTGVDSCGQSYPVQYGSDLSSIHLISFSGGNNQAQLIWNNIYAPASFIPQYYIYRNSNGGGWQVIDSIGITLSTITYTDILAPAGNNQYTVELRKLNPCTPMRASSIAYQSVFSNVSTAMVTLTEELTNNARISIYPNPATNNFTIDLNYLEKHEYDISIIDMQGKKCLDQHYFAEKVLIVEKGNLNRGVYTVEIKGDKTYRSKLVIQ